MKQDNDKRSFLDKVFAKVFSSKPVTVTGGALSPNPSGANMNFAAPTTPGKSSLYMNPALSPRDMFTLPKPVEVTNYTPEKGQTDSRPLEMASGKRVYDGAIATGDRSIPFGTKVYIPELKKEFTVEDRMNKRYDKSNKQKKDFIDIVHAKANKKTKQKALEFGRKQLSFVPLAPASSTPPVTLID